MKLHYITPDGGFVIEGSDAASIVRMTGAPPWVATAIDAWRENAGQGDHEVHFAPCHAFVVPAARPPHNPVEEEINRKVSTYSDYHKDFYGYRPGGLSHLSRDEIAEAYDRISAAFQAEMQTPTGRARLRANGWCIPDEPAPPAKKVPARKSPTVKIARSK